jgi:hypothetical protein
MKTSEIIKKIFIKNPDIGITYYSSNAACRLRGQATPFELSRAKWIGIIKKVGHGRPKDLCGYCFEASLGGCKKCIFNNAFAPASWEGRIKLVGVTLQNLRFCPPGEADFNKGCAGISNHTPIEVLKIIIKKQRENEDANKNTMV